MDFFNALIRFFTDKEYSSTSKFVGLILFLAILLCIDNLLGFSFYYSNSQKISQLKTIESLKDESRDNKRLMKALNQAEKEIITRRNIFESFINLFSKEPLDQKYDFVADRSDTVFIYKYDTIILREGRSILSKYYYPPDTNKLRDLRIRSDTLNKFNEYLKSSEFLFKSVDSADLLIYDSKKKDRSFPQKKRKDEIKKSRSQVWHTISSSYLLLFLFVFLPFIPFTEKTFSWNLMLGMIIFMIFDAGLIWINQYLLGLIPVIANKPWINYILNFIIHTGFWSLIVYIINKKKLV